MTPDAARQARRRAAGHVLPRTATQRARDAELSRTRWQWRALHREYHAACDALGIPDNRGTT